MPDSSLKLQTSGGYPTPFGVTRRINGTNFSVYSKHATTVTFYFFEDNNPSPVKKVDITNKTGDVWHVLIYNLPPHFKYAYRINGPQGRNQTLSYHPDNLLLDPYAKAVDTTNYWEEEKYRTAYQPLGIVSSPKEFDWEQVKPPNLLLKDLVIYEMHVRGFTQHSSSGAKNKGTFLGVIEKIPHLVELGINAIELLPVTEFNEMENKLRNPSTHKKLCNYWGYSPVNFFSLMNRYATSKALPGEVIIEFKTMVRELHRQGIEVILDVVFNHTAEGNERGPVISYKGIDPTVYYLFDQRNHYSNYTGCGNTINGNHPAVVELIRDCLRYWVSEMHIDGFRFDLASVLTRGLRGEPLSPSPLIEAISQDPVLSSARLIAEPWDAQGLYQLGSFYPGESRWSEWNDQYRKCVRRFIKGTPHEKRVFATRVCGSQDLYGNRSPLSSINYATCHDGFSLYDLVSYNVKHNLENGEDDRDGNPDNDSWNCGFEGPTTNPKILALRERQIRNFHLVLMLSQGIPMLLMGDEYKHTRRGNNNPWGHDNELNWFLWNKLEENKGFFRFYKGLIHFRKKHPTLKNDKFLSPSEIEWHGHKPYDPKWDLVTLFIAFIIKEAKRYQDLYAAFNASSQAVQVVLPPPPKSKNWHLIVNTASDPPLDFIEEENASPLNSDTIEMVSHSAVLLKAL